MCNRIYRILFIHLLAGLTFLPAWLTANAGPGNPIVAAKSSIKITGTSTIHDWEIEVKDFSGWMNGQGQGSETVLEGGKLSCKVKSFSSGIGSMDKVVFNAMKEKDYPNVVFELTEILKSEDSQQGQKIQAIGKLTIAGTTKGIQLEMTGNKDQNAFRIKGSKHFKMSDFNIEPPTAMFGTVRSGDEINILFDIHFKIN